MDHQWYPRGGDGRTHSREDDGMSADARLAAIVIAWDRRRRQDERAKDAAYDLPDDRSETTG